MFELLDNKTYKLLKRIYRKKRIKFSEVRKITGIESENRPNPYISVLMTNKYIKYWSSDKIIGEFGEREQLGYEITLEGNSYVEQRIRDRRNFWVPYLITTFIALLSLIVSLAEHWNTILSWFGVCNPCS